MVQCALNGAYTRADHPAVPVTREQTVADAIAWQAAGHDVRVGLEDTLIGRDGGPAPDNAGQVASVA